MGLDNDKTLNVLGQERNDFWSPPYYNLFRHEKIIIVHLKDDFLRDSLWSSIEESSNVCYKQKFLYGIQIKAFYSIKSLITILESSKDDETD